MNPTKTSTKKQPLGSKIEAIRKTISELQDPNGSLGICEIIQTVTKAHPDARRADLKEVLVGDLGLNPGTVHRQIQEARKAN